MWLAPTPPTYDGKPARSINSVYVAGAQFLDCGDMQSAKLFMVFTSITYKLILLVLEVSTTFSSHMVDSGSLHDGPIFTIRSSIGIESNVAVLNVKSVSEIEICIRRKKCPIK